MKQLSPERSVFLPYTDMNMHAGNCHKNVDKIVAQHGGNPVFGWIIWSNHDLFDAEFHCVWQDESGTLHDVTPRRDGEKEILFLPDPSRKFDWENFLTFSNVCFNHRTQRRQPTAAYFIDANGDGRMKCVGVDRK